MQPATLVCKIWASYVAPLCHHNFRMLINKEIVFVLNIVHNVMQHLRYHGDKDLSCGLVGCDTMYCITAWYHNLELH